VQLEFTFPDLDDRLVSLSDPQFRGKVVIVTLAGSWCPNCHDEAAFLAQLHRELGGQGLEVVSLMFEHFVTSRRPPRRDAPPVPRTNSASSTRR